AQAVVHEAVAVARRLDADADGRSADRYVLELGRDERQVAVIEAVTHDRLVGREPFDLHGAARIVYPENVIELAERQTPRRCAARLISEQVRDRRLLKPQRSVTALPTAREPRCLRRVALRGGRDRHSRASTERSSHPCAHTAPGTAAACRRRTRRSTRRDT